MKISNLSPKQNFAVNFIYLSKKGGEFCKANQLTAEGGEYCAARSKFVCIKNHVT